MLSATKVPKLRKKVNMYLDMHYVDLVASERQQDPPKVPKKGSLLA